MAMLSSVTVRLPGFYGTSTTKAILPFLPEERKHRLPTPLEARLCFDREEAHL